MILRVSSELPRWSLVVALCLAVAACRNRGAEAYHARAGSPGAPELRWATGTEGETGADEQADWKFGSNPFDSRAPGRIDEVPVPFVCEVEVEIRDGEVFQGKADGPVAEEVHAEARRRACAALSAAREIDCADASRATVGMTHETSLVGKDGATPVLEVVYTAIPFVLARGVGQSPAGREQACEHAVADACRAAGETRCPQTTVVRWRRSSAPDDESAQ